VKIGRATLWRYKYVAPRVEKGAERFGLSASYYSRVNSTVNSTRAPGSTVQFFLSPV
jgi:hypothetical protein